MTDAERIARAVEIMRQAHEYPARRGVVTVDTEDGPRGSVTVVIRLSGRLVDSYAISRHGVTPVESGAAYPGDDVSSLVRRVVRDARALFD